jgi:hypothetical protein
MPDEEIRQVPERPKTATVGARWIHSPIGNGHFLCHVTNDYRSGLPQRAVVARLAESA